MGAAMIELLGDDLAILSLRVAQQVDRKLSGKSYDRKVFQDFGKELSKATGISDPNAYSLFRSDPSVTEVFAQAVTEVSNHPISDITELTNALGDIIGPLADC